MLEQPLLALGWWAVCCYINLARTGAPIVYAQAIAASTVGAAIAHQSRPSSPIAPAFCRFRSEPRTPKPRANRCLRTRCTTTPAIISPRRTPCTANSPHNTGHGRTPTPIITASAITAATSISPPPNTSRTATARLSTPPSTPNPLPNTVLTMLPSRRRWKAGMSSPSQRPLGRRSASAAQGSASHVRCAMRDAPRLS